ncbi:MAG: hypothetical protein U0821_10540 [Chloroflexota bacterium]
MSGWELLSQRPGGTVTSLLVVAEAGRQRVLAGTPVGPFVSDDGGLSWRDPANGSRPPFVESLACDGGRWYAAARGGVFTSVDRGRIWRHALTGSRVLCLAAPAANIVFAGTETDGVLRSDDGGTRWRSVNPGLQDLTVLATAFSPDFARDQTGFVATATGLSRTRNGGLAWRALDLPFDETAVQCLAVSPRFAEDGLVLAGTESDGLLISEDGGTSWDEVQETAGRGVLAVAVDPAGASIMAATDTELLVSTDLGLTWGAGLALPGLVLSLAWVGLGAERLLLASLVARGIAVSRDGGRTWQAANQGLYARTVDRLVLSPRFAIDRTVFSLSLDEGIERSTDGGRTWEAMTDGARGDGVTALVAVPSRSGAGSLVAAMRGELSHRSADGAWTASLPGAMLAGADALSVVADGGSGAILAGLEGRRLVVSRDDGETWHDLEPPPNGEILAVAASAERASGWTVFALTQDSDGGRALWRSVDGNGRWARWLEPTPGGAVSVAVPPWHQSDGAVFLAAGRAVMRPIPSAEQRVRGERRPLWTETLVGTEGAVISGMSLSPAFRADGTVFVATSEGVFLSRDRGQTFEPWSEGMDAQAAVSVTPAADYATSGEVFALALGGGLWRRVDGVRG